MPRLPEEHMADIHIIRQDYAQALANFEAVPIPSAKAALEEARDRRDRAIRMVHREDGAGIKHLAAIFRCPKWIVRKSIQEGEQ
jgi:hypothetical protein